MAPTVTNKKPDFEQLLPPLCGEKAINGKIGAETKLTKSLTHDAICGMVLRIRQADKNLYEKSVILIMNSPLRVQTNFLR